MSSQSGDPFIARTMPFAAVAPEIVWIDKVKIASRDQVRPAVWVRLFVERKADCCEKSLKR
jgi:hypothetical protein